jgi:phage terminase Nu1 subunit (DNA packaging protein)
MSTINEVCDWLDISDTTFKTKLRRGVIEKQPRGQYDIQTIARALIKDRQAESGGHGDHAANLDLSKERARLAREQADAVALKNASARRENVPMALVQKAVEIVFMAFRERCLSIPGKIAASCDMRPSTEVEEIVRDEVYEALDELTRPIIPLEPPHGWLDETISAEAGAVDDDEVGHD